MSILSTRITHCRMWCNSNRRTCTVIYSDAHFYIRPTRKVNPGLWVMLLIVTLPGSGWPIPKIALSLAKTHSAVCGDVLAWLNHLCSRWGREIKRTSSSNRETCNIWTTHTWTCTQTYERTHIQARAFPIPTYVFAYITAYKKRPLSPWWELMNSHIQRSSHFCLLDISRSSGQSSWMWASPLAALIQPFFPWLAECLPACIFHQITPRTEHVLTIDVQ